MKWKTTNKIINWFISCAFVDYLQVAGNVMAKQRLIDLN